MSITDPRPFEGELFVTDLSEEERNSLLKLPYPSLKYTSAKDPSLNPQPSVYGEDGSFFEDFADGIDFEHWFLLQGRWGHGNNGVLPENAFCTADGVLVLRANGDWYTGNIGDKIGRRTGSVLTTKRACGAGSYEARIKTLPRMGSCSAIWTFFNDGVRNHEIDIELPGNRKNFCRPLFTNWLTVDDNAQTAACTAPQNDGEWHTYRFDWHTSPPRVEYYVDGKFEHAYDHHVPTVAGLFNVGVWLPWEWCGDPEFKSAYMLVDWVKYTPFDEPCEPYTRPLRFPPKSEERPLPLLPLPVNNFVAGGTFSDPLSLGWKTDGEAAVVRLSDTLSLLRLKAGAAVTQRISSISSALSYDLRFTAVTLGGEIKLSLRFESADGTVQSEETLCVDEEAFSVKRLSLLSPQNAAFLRLTFESVGGTGYVGDVFLTQPARGDFCES